MKQQLYLFVITIVLILSAPDFVLAQNTVGLIQYNKSKAYDGYNLVFPHNQSSVFLFNNCGEIINEWTDSQDFRPGNMAYLTEDGNLIKCKRFFNATMDSIWAGGGGEIVEMLDWDNNLMWSFTLNDSLDRLHHDVAPLPNGNVLMIAWEYRSGTEAIEAGRNPEMLEQNKLWPDYILEYNPSLDSIVWEWHSWDHLIQDFDASKENFGNVSEHPELIDINYQTNLGFPDWLHSNAIDYNEDLDQILLCVPHFDEIWIIDHSTTTQEAASHAGGLSGRGGDLLYRWGNPGAYKKVDPQQLFFAHDARWTNDFRTTDQDYFYSISVFNNRVADNYSTVNIISPQLSLIDNAYAQSTTGTFLPGGFDLTLTHPDTFSLYSNSLSSAQVLPNDNVLICSGRFGRVFEIDPTSNNVVWEYRVPLIGGSPVEQGTQLEFNNNITFRVNRYPLDYEGFEGRDLTTKEYWELNPNLEFCDTISAAVDYTTFSEDINIFPNPVVENSFVLDKGNLEIDEVYIYNITGRPLKKIKMTSTKTKISTEGIGEGLYFIGTTNQIIGKLVIL